MRKSGVSKLLVTFLFLAALASPLSVWGQTTSDKAIVGNWVGWAVPAAPFQAPFDQVRFQVTFFSDGTAYWNDGHELRFDHGTGHGAWKKIGVHGFESTFLWVAFDKASASGAGNIFKLRFRGNVSGDDLTDARLNLTIFPPGTDPLNPNDVGGNPVFGTFEVKNARRVKLDPPQNDISGDPTGEYVLGAWWGKALPADPSTAPFPEVVMMLNFMPDHNIVATDVFELASPHTTAHGGPWARTSDGIVHCIFLWTNMTKETDYNGYAKVRITGKIDPTDIDFMTGTVRPTGFATGADVLDPSDPFSGFFGQFNIVELTRVKADPTIPTKVGQDYSANLSSGVWYGKAVANDPSSPIKEIVIMPHFLPNGNVVWNDSQEQGHPHGTGFGNWAPSGTGSNGVKAVGVLQKFDVSKANSFGGVYKLKFNGQVDPSTPNKMGGTFELVDFPASAITLPSPDRNLVFHRDPLDTGGKSLGTYTITELRRIENQPLPAGGVAPSIPSNPIVGHTYLNKEELVGNWVGWAVPAIQFQAPFDQVRFQVTFFEDGTAYWNDGHELRFGHGTGHGAWKKVGGNRFESTFLWVAFDATSATGAGNIFKLQFNGNVNGDDLTNARLNLTIFPPGTDPLSDNNVGGIPVFGTFDVESARRVKLDPPQTDLSGDPTGELVLGAWWGKALPADPSTAPFPEVVMMLNFMPDHNIVATDVFELASPHVTAHGGPWARTSDGVNCTFLWTNMTKESDYNGYAKVRIVGKIDANDKDYMTGTVRPTGFATGADVLDQNDPFSGFFGQFNIAELTRIKADPTIPTQVGQNYSANLSSGVWYGKAVANDPSSPIREIVIMPHFLPSGNVVWNDSQEQSHPHGTGFGNWAPGTGSNGVKAVGVLQKFDVSKANSFGGMYKLKFNGQVNPSTPNQMSGSFELVDFPASAITLPSPDRNLVFHRDPNDTGGQSLGTFTITELRRITPSALTSAPVVVTNLQRSVVNVTVTNGGVPVSGAVVSMAKSVSGRSLDYAWAGTTGTDGKAKIDIAVTSSRSAAGYYQAIAKDSNGKVIGQWASIPINGGQTIGLVLQIGGAAILESAIATTFGLQQNSPNPFNPSTQISYDIPVSGDVQLTIYNTLGQVVRTLVSGHQEAGRYLVEWNGRDALNRQVASGIYYYRLVSGPNTAVRGMLMLK